MNRTVTALLLSAFALAGCSSWSMPTMPSMEKLPDEMAKKWAAIKPYTLDIQQGVVIDQDMIARLKPGMSRLQVGYVLGSPLLADPFHANRWDYVYYTRKKGVVSKPHNLTVFFKEDKLERFETDYPLPPKPPEPPKASEVKPPAPPPEVLPNTSRPVTTPEVR
ncbi:MAG: outer membrane protein assembly factor BamE [Betaproteobacteria bacterium]|nr:outer membrane protein assembly factor BamE [Betaproteobacteria bacterium]